MAETIAEERHDELTFPAELPVLPLKETVVFPGFATPLAIGQERSIKLVEEVVSGDRVLALVTVQNDEPEQPGWDDLYRIGTAAVVQKMIKVPDGTLRILVQGLHRIGLDHPVQDDPYLVGEFIEMADELEETREVEALTRNVQNLFTRIISLVPYLPEELQIAAANVEDPSALCNLVASTLRLKTEEKQRLLELVGVEARLREVSSLLNRELEVFELGSKIQSQVQEEMEKGQREFFLRQQLKAIQDELGEGDADQAELTELRSQFDSMNLPEEVRKVADRELARLEKLPSAAAEYGVIRTYLDWLATLPWDKTTEDNLDLEQARKVLDEDHYDLDKVKERILEYLAVSKLKNDLSGPILCFVGPPGVGKTSLGQSIARTLGRKFVRISVGGVRDEAEIRGHRRTYIGAMPGTIIRSLRDAESLNPVILIDEIDKMGADFRGDPASAMLEVLDPEQNKHFRDHYLDLPFDLSKVLFICTANTLDAIPTALLDRMDVIQLSGYTEDEKFGIAKRYLVPKQLEAHGLDGGRVVITDKALRLIIREYTREAGVRNLERRLADVLRKAARQIAEGKTRAKTLRIDARRVRSWLGPRRFEGEVRRRTSEPGVATGLAFTAVGGDVLFFEATAYSGKGRLTITGQLGDVMQESAQTALSWVRAHAEQLGLDPEWFREHDVHLHVPAGAVPKDGPSAGITIATAIASLVRGEPVSAEVGMTGEITLTGQVLPIGGIREKALAAQRAGLKRVILPRENEPDLAELPAETKRELEFVLVDTIEEVFEGAFDGKAATRSKPVAVSEQAVAQAGQRLARGVLDPRAGVGRPHGQSPRGL
jgi:ATP-dependent Lon protease